MQDTTRRVLARRTVGRVLPDGTYLEAELLLRAFGEQSPAFSATGTVWKSRGWAMRTRPDHAMLEGGAIGAKIAYYLPAYAPVVALHLADEHGEPMHAVENGWYAYSGKAHEHERAEPRWYAAATDTPHERAARCLRVSPAELPAGLDRAGFVAFVETLRPRWAAEARAALELLEPVAVALEGGGSNG